MSSEWGRGLDREDDEPKEGGEPAEGGAAPIEGEGSAVTPAGAPADPPATAPSKPPRKGRKDKGFTRIAVPRALAERWKKLADAQGGVAVADVLQAQERELVELRKGVGDVGPSLHSHLVSRLEAAAEATGRSTQNVLAEFHEDLLALFAGQLFREQELEADGNYNYAAVPGLRERALAVFEKRLGGV